MVHFGEFLKTWSLRSNSVTRQVNFKRTKIDEKCQNWKTQMWHFGWFSNTVDYVESFFQKLALGWKQVEKKKAFEMHSCFGNLRWPSIRDFRRLLDGSNFWPKIKILFHTCWNVLFLKNLNNWVWIIAKFHSHSWRGSLNFVHLYQQLLNSIMGQ